MPASDEFDSSDHCNECRLGAPSLARHAGYFPRVARVTPSRRWFFARLLTQHVLITVVIEQLTELSLPIVLFRLTFRDLEVRHVRSLGRVNLVCHVSLQNINRLGGDGVYTRRGRLPVPSARAALHCNQGVTRGREFRLPRPGAAIDPRLQAPNYAPEP
jgi:hypothetical protein